MRLEYKKAGIFLTKRIKSSMGLEFLLLIDVVDRYEGTLDISYNQDSFRVVVLIG